MFDRKLYFNCSVQIINSAIKQNQECDLLIQDECHLFASQQFKQVFQKIKYKLILHNKNGGTQIWQVNSRKTWWKGGNN